MIYQVPHFVWAVCRKCVRAKSPVRGNDLRPGMAQRYKYGRFLNAMTKLGLLEIVVDGVTWISSTYALTELGKHVAEYGEFDVDVNIINKFDWLTGDYK